MGSTSAMAPRATAVFYGEVSGGQAGYYNGGPGGSGAELGALGSLTNRGVIQGGQGGFGYYYLGLGGVGVNVNGGSLLNTGLIEGGNGALFNYGGVGVAVNSGSIVNTGTVIGGAGATGGDGLDLFGAGSAVNRGEIIGGAGAQGDNLGFFGGRGGYVFDGASLTNTGLIIGGIGSSGAFLGDGGAGLQVGAGGIVTNTGTIIGGPGNANSSPGTGVVLDDGTLINAGTISSGTDGTSVTGYALVLGGYPSGNTADLLIIDPGASFIGEVFANPAADAALQLAGKGIGTFTGLGSQFTGFASVTVEAGSHWVLSGMNLAAEGGSKNTAIVIDGIAEDSGDLEAPAITIGSSGVLELDGVALSSALVNSGTVLAIAGATATLSGAISGTGLLAAQAGGTLELAAALSTGGTLGGTGTILLDDPLTLAAGAQLTARDVIAEQNVTLGAGVDIATAKGGTFSLGQAASGKISLSGQTGDTFTNAGTFTASGTGPADVTVAFINQHNVSSNTTELVFSGGLTNNGVITDNAGSLAITTQVAGTGKLLVGATGALALQQGATSGQTVQFLAGTGLLDLSVPAMFAGTIKGFGGSDEIDLLKTHVSSFTYSGHELTLDSGTSTVATLEFFGGYKTSSFEIVSDMHGGTIVKFV